MLPRKIRTKISLYLYYNKYPCISPTSLKTSLNISQCTTLLALCVDFGCSLACYVNIYHLHSQNSSNEFHPWFFKCSDLLFNVFNGIIIVNWLNTSQLLSSPLIMVYINIYRYTWQIYICQYGFSKKRTYCHRIHIYQNVTHFHHFKCKFSAMKNVNIKWGHLNLNDSIATRMVFT